MADASLSATLLPAAVPDGPVTFSVRPGSIGLHEAAGDPGTAWWLHGTVAERAYLGEHWDYMVRDPVYAVCSAHTTRSRSAGIQA